MDDEEEGSELESESDEDDEYEQYEPVSASYVQSRISKGSTLQLLQPQRWTPPILQLLTHLERCFCGLVGSNAYLTPASAQGLALHCDDVEVFACQLEGTKEWRLYAPLDPLARTHSPDYRRSEVGAETHRVILREGDMLYVPRGTVHQANTRTTYSSSSEAAPSSASRASTNTSSSSPSPSRPHSLHLTISCYQRTSWYDLLEIGIRKSLDRLLDESLDLRRGLPVGFLRYINTAQEQADELLPDLADPHRLALVQAFQQHHAQLVHRVLSRVDAAEAGDEMAIDFFLHRLPPLPADLAGDGAGDGADSARGMDEETGDGEKKEPSAGQTAVGAGGDGLLKAQRWEEWLMSESEEKYDVGERPLNPQQRVRLLHPDYIHCCLVPAKSKPKRTTALQPQMTAQGGRREPTKCKRPRPTPPSPSPPSIPRGCQ